MQGCGGVVVYRRGKEKKSRGSDCKVQSLHCAITITGGRQPARVDGMLTSFPTFRLLDLLALWLVPVEAACVWVQRSPDAYLREGVHQGC